jgi:phage repressor protein C with HTH and peptisase S24 domain
MKLSDIAVLRLNELGLGAVEAAVKAGLERTFIRDLAQGRKKSVQAGKINALAAALKLDAAALSNGEIIRLEDKPAPNADLRPDPRFAVLKDVPVLGTAAGSVLGDFKLFGGPVDYVARPPALSGAAGLYAFYVEGDSMAPEHKAGELRLVSPHKPPRQGDSVIVQTRGHAGGVTAMIGHYLKTAGGKLFIGKISPVPRTVEIPLETVLHCHKVLSVNEMMGV